MRRSSRWLFWIVLLAFGQACDTPVTTVDPCGDGVLDPGEECDGAMLAVISCQDLGFYDQLGVLTCNADCTLDRGVCVYFCGDGGIQAEFGEECDQEALGGATCESLGLGEGTVTCKSDCRLDTSGCAISYECGDQEITAPYEVCDGPELGGETCRNLGYNGGTLACLSDCSDYDLTSCEATGRCGDGVITAPFEQCEGEDFGGATCQSLGYHGGALACDADCAFVRDGCIGRCGDLEVQGYYGEVCDGTNLDGQSCQSLGYYGGELVCGADCLSFNESSCRLAGRCGDGILQDNEVCDGALFGGGDLPVPGFPDRGSVLRRRLPADRHPLVHPGLRHRPALRPGVRGLHDHRARVPGRLDGLRGVQHRGRLRSEPRLFSRRSHLPARLFGRVRHGVRRVRRRRRLPGRRGPGDPRGVAGRPAVSTVS